MKAYRLTLTIISFALVLLCTVTLSFGWYAKYTPVGPNWGITGGSVGQFEAFQLRSDNAGILTVNPATKFGGDTPTEMDPDQMQFGLISNLSTLEPQNYIFYAIKIPKTMGTNITLGFAYLDIPDKTVTGINPDTNLEETINLHFDIRVPGKEEESNKFVPYSQTIDENYAQNMYNISRLESASTFIIYSYATSTTAPDTFENFEELNALFSTTSGDQTTSNPTYSLSAIDLATSLPVESSLQNPTAPTLGDTDQYYYIYLKLQPNLDIYAGFIDYLWNNMPFCLAYSMQVYLTVR